MLKKILELKDKILDNAEMFNFVRSITDSRSHNLSIVKKELDAGRQEKILDIGCGIGNFSKFAEGSYTGIDFNENFIKYAIRHYGGKNKMFMVMDAKKLKFRNKSFDKSIFVGMLHHFSDEECGMILKEAMRVTKKRLVISDMLPTKGLNLPLPRKMLVNFIYKMDRGSSIRPKEKQLEIVRKYFKVEKFIKYNARMGINSLMVCRPLR